MRLSDLVRTVGSSQNITLISLGTIVGHSLCTALAVVGGAWLASRISPKHITLGGAALFFIFGFVYLFESWEEYSTLPVMTVLLPAAVVQSDLSSKVGGLQPAVAEALGVPQRG